VKIRHFGHLNSGIGRKIYKESGDIFEISLKLVFLTIECGNSRNFSKLYLSANFQLLNRNCNIYSQDTMEDS
jgi:hypothetical protein